MSAADVEAGTTSTEPITARLRTIVVLMPRSMATTRRSAPVLDGVSGHARMT